MYAQSQTKYGACEIMHSFALEPKIIADYLFFVILFKKNEIKISRGQYQQMIW